MTKAEDTAIAVFSKPHQEAVEVLTRIADLLRRRNIALLADESTARALGLPDWISREKAVERARMVIAVGGDGTLLASARAVGPAEKPILGVNLGSLGFLTETRCEEVEEVLTAALEGQAPVHLRWALTVRKDSQSSDGRRIALNDVVFSKSDLARLFSLSLFVDDQWVADYRADGLIISTPTGSTAYNLAAGGPLVLPGVDALLVTPICPHSLSQRPLILPGDARLAISLTEGSKAGNVQVTLDGQVGYPIESGEKIFVHRSSHPVRLIRPPGRSFFWVLRDKLGWGHL